MVKMLREPDALEKAGLGKTKFKRDFIDSGRLRWLYSGRTKRIAEHELDRVLREDLAARDASPPSRPKPAFSREAYLKGARAPKRRAKAAAGSVTA
jgi:hypothetical protein